MLARDEGFSLDTALAVNGQVHGVVVGGKSQQDPGGQFRITDDGDDGCPSGVGLGGNEALATEAQSANRLHRGGRVAGDVFEQGECGDGRHDVDGAGQGGWITSSRPWDQQPSGAARPAGRVNPEGQH